MLLASAIWAVVSAINYGEQSLKQAPGPIAILLIGIPTLYAAIVALWAWRGRVLVLKQPLKPVKNKLLFAVGVGLVLCLATTLITYMLSITGLKLAPSNQQVLQNLGKQWPLVMVFFAVAVAPVFEELFFRKQLFARFANAGHVLLGYMLSSLLFALMHEPFPTQGIGAWLLMLALYGALGAVFAWVYRTTGRLWPAILAHASNNFFAIVMLFILS